MTPQVRIDADADADTDADAFGLFHSFEYSN